jgi:transposase
MKKITTAKKNHKALSKTEKKQIWQKASQQRLTVGLDLGDNQSRYHILDEVAVTVSTGQLPTTKTGLRSLFEKMPPSRVALEVGTHSPWVSRLLTELRHEVIVANTHKVRLITQSVKKNDRIDAEKLARLARVDPKLLSPIRHRGEVAQADLAVIRGRAGLVEARTGLINTARGLVKPFGERLKSCDADQVGEGLQEGLSEAARRAVQPLLRSVEAVSEQMRVYDKEIEEIAKRYPEVEMLRQVYGVGQLIGLTFVLTIEDPSRFEHSRDVGPFLGLTPRQGESGDRQPELGITKAGDQLLRSLLVQGAHCLLRKGAPESDLRNWGMEKMEKGGKNAKRRAIVGVARKLAVLLHRLWVTGEVYDPLYNQKQKPKGKQAGGAAA